MDLPALLLSVLHMNMPRDRERGIHCKAAAIPEKDVQ